LIEIDVQCLG